jgi:hypothetical protein
MPLRVLASLFYFLSLVPCMAQHRHMPNIEAQRAAMKKLEFMVGKWTGEARFLHGPGDPISLTQTEEAQYKLDGLILLVEGVGRTKADGKPALQALGIISYDDESRTYRMLAFNDGRTLETELKLMESGKGVTWGFELGQIRTSSVMRITEKGDWTELTEITIGSETPTKYMELTVSRDK